MYIMIYNKMIRVTVGAVVALGLCATVAMAQDTSKKEEADRFQLFTKCLPVYPTVSLELTSAYLEDLEEAEVEELVLTGLRSAQLLGDQPEPPFLFVTVGIVHWAFSVRVELMKELTDPMTELRGARRPGKPTGTECTAETRVSSCRASAPP